MSSFFAFGIIKKKKSVVNHFDFGFHNALIRSSLIYPWLLLLEFFFFFWIKSQFTLLHYIVMYIE